MVVGLYVHYNFPHPYKVFYIIHIRDYLGIRIIHQKSAMTL